MNRWQYMAMSATAVIVVAASTEGVAQAVTPAPTAAMVAAEVRTAVAAHGQELAAANTKAGVQSGPSDEHTLVVGTADGKTVGLRLPATPGDAAGSIVGSQTVFRSTAQHFYVTADATADGARGAVSIQDALAPSRYVFGLDLPAGVSADLTPDGSVALRSRMNGFVVQLGEVAAPWAQDARGHAVPTHFEVNGSTIIQVVDHRSAGVTYPVVADPTLTYGRGTYLNLWGWQADAIGNALGLLISGGVFVGCKVAKIPNPIVANIVRVICAAGAAQFGAKIFNSLGSTHHNPRGCYQTKILPSDGRWVGIDPKNCQ